MVAEKVAEKEEDVNKSIAKASQESCKLAVSWLYAGCMLAVYSRNIQRTKRKKKSSKSKAEEGLYTLQRGIVIWILPEFCLNPRSSQKSIIFESYRIDSTTETLFYQPFLYVNARGFSDRVFGISLSKIFTNGEENRRCTTNSSCSHRAPVYFIEIYSILLQRGLNRIKDIQNISEAGIHLDKLIKWYVCIMLLKEQGERILRPQRSERNCSCGVT